MCRTESNARPRGSLNKLLFSKIELFREFLAKQKERGDSRENKNVWTIFTKIFSFSKTKFH